MTLLKNSGLGVSSAQSGSGYRTWSNSALYASMRYLLTLCGRLSLIVLAAGHMTSSLQLCRRECQHERNSFGGS